MKEKSAKRWAIFICLLVATSISGFAQPTLSYTPLIQNLAKPVNVKNARDGSGRLFIIEQSGLIKIYKNGALLSTPFLDLRNIVDTGVYQGIWSIAFPSNYTTTKNFYVYYVDKKKNTVLARFTTSSNPDSGIANSRVTLFSVPKTGSNDPHLGEMHFGPDNYLYISINDGSIYSVNFNYAQDGSVFYGKMLRLDINNNVTPFYKIPPDNPFINDTSIRDEIWAMGVRNFWRWSFDRATGNMWLAEDGADRWDEINMRKKTQPAGANFGWPCYEGTDTFSLVNCKPKKNYAFPVYNIPPDPNAFGAQAIIGGYVYRGSAYPSLKGYYLCSDYFTNYVWKMVPNSSGGVNVFKQANIPPGIASYGEGEDGELYAASLSTGTIYKIGVAAQSPVLADVFSSSTLTAINNGIKIYPTVISDHSLYIESSQQIKSVRITDLSGQQIMYQKLSGFAGKAIIQIPSSLNAGMYLLQVEANKNITQKIYISY